jgi:hypothetical protein
MRLRRNLTGKRRATKTTVQATKTVQIAGLAGLHSRTRRSVAATTPKCRFDPCRAHHEIKRLASSRLTPRGPGKRWVSRKHSFARREGSLTPHQRRLDRSAYEVPARRCRLNKCPLNPPVRNCLKRNGLPNRPVGVLAHSSPKSR